MTKVCHRHELLKQVQIGDRILLVNPPVFETRYNWLRWNQPLDLLRIGAYLKSSKKCDVELFDFMLPNTKATFKKGFCPDKSDIEKSATEISPTRIQCGDLESRSTH